MSKNLFKKNFLIETKQKPDWKFTPKRVSPFCSEDFIATEHEVHRTVRRTCSQFLANAKQLFLLRESLVEHNEFPLMQFNYGRLSMALSAHVIRYISIRATDIRPANRWKQDWWQPNVCVCDWWWSGDNKTKTKKMQFCWGSMNSLLFRAFLWFNLWFEFEIKFIEQKIASFIWRFV